MVATAVVGLLIVSCLGSGSATLSILRINFRSSALDHYAWSFAVGFGVIGWLLFFVAAGGWLNKAWLLVILAVCGIGLFVPSFARLEGWSEATPGTIEWLAIAAASITFTMSILEGTSPPTDADSLAYHFALPKQFLAAGRLEFVPRAIDGAIPLLPQMTYMAALGLGGERAMTLWVMVTGWGAAAVVYTVARQYLDRAWSLGSALVFYTTPAVVYGAGSGQVEVKLSMFATLAAFATARAVRSGDTRYAILAGLGAGFFAGGKLVGLLFAVCCGLTAILQRRWFAHGAAFGIAAVVSGFQWPLWNWIHSGDPLFPLLFDWLPYRDPTFWNTAHHAFFQAEWNQGELPLSKTLWGLIAYPFEATFYPLPAFESGRTGFGPLPALLLPFAVLAVFSFRDRISKSELGPVAAIVCLFYVTWFFIGPSQRIRHLLPVLPCLLIALTAAGVRWADTTRCRRPLIAAFGLTLLIQFGGQTVYMIRYASHVLSGGDRDSFLRRSVFGYQAAAWVNANVPPKSLVATDLRQLIYLVERPVYYAHPIDQARLNLRPDATVSGFAGEVARLGITHVLSVKNIDPAGQPSALTRLTGALIEHGCGEILTQIPLPTLASRTFPGPRAVHEMAVVARLDTVNCSLISSS